MIGLPPLAAVFTTAKGGTADLAAASGTSVFLFLTRNKPQSKPQKTEKDKLTTEQFAVSKEAPAELTD